MKSIPTTFRRDGFDLVQIVRLGDCAIYRKFRGRHVGFEVIRISQHHGKTIEPSEMYPSSKKWGVDGFTVPDYATALEKLAELVRADAKNAVPDFTGTQ